MPIKQHSAGSVRSQHCKTSSRSLTGLGMLKLDLCGAAPSSWSRATACAQASCSTRTPTTSTSHRAGKVPSGHRTRKATTLMEKRKRAKERKKQRTSGGDAPAAVAADVSVAAAASSQDENAGHGCWEGVWYDHRGEMQAPRQDAASQWQWEPQFQDDPLPRAWQRSTTWETPQAEMAPHSRLLVLLDPNRMA